MPLTIQQEIEALPADLQQEVQDFIAFLRFRHQDRIPEAAALTAIRDARQQVLGSLKGRIRIAPDFDAPLPDMDDYQ